MLDKYKALSDEALEQVTGGAGTNEGAGAGDGEKVIAKKSAKCPVCYPQIHELTDFEVYSGGRAKCLRCKTVFENF
jgi:hypothetical protein